jgi:hypothetical protein
LRQKVAEPDLRPAPARARGPILRSWPRPTHRLLEGIPIISSDLLRRGDVVVKPATERLNGDRACFVDGFEEPVEHIIVVRGARLASDWEYARRRDGYATAGLDA